MIYWPLLIPALGWVAYGMGAHPLAWNSVRRGPGGKKAIALTFDDGPDPVHTPELLRLLSRYEARATFFLVGERAVAAPHVVKSIIEAGHEVGNHTWSHRNLWWSTPRQTRDEICRAAGRLAELSGTEIRFFRPPWGMVNLAVFPTLRRLGSQCVFWSIQPEGLRAASPDMMIQRVMRKARPGAIVDLHDAEGLPGAPQRLLAALPEMIERLRGDGYALVLLGELLSADKNEPSRPEPTSATISRVSGDGGSGK